MTEPEKVDWWATNPSVELGRMIGPYTSQAEAWLTVVNEDGIPFGGSFVWCTPKKTETIQSESTVNNFSDTTVFPCNIVPKSRLYDTYT